MGIHIDLILPEFRLCNKEMLPHFTCSICTDLLDDTITLKECDHIFCRSCLTDWIKNQNDETNVSCPECRVGFTIPTDVHDARVIRNVLSTFKFKCANQPCEAIVPYDDIKLHPTECPYTSTQCTFCEENTLRKDSEAHLEDCLYYIKYKKSELQIELEKLKTELSELSELLSAREAVICNLKVY